MLNRGPGRPPGNRWKVKPDKTKCMICLESPVTIRNGPAGGWIKNGFGLCQVCYERAIRTFNGNRIITGQKDITAVEMENKVIKLF
jgi:hypothetical protein